MDIKDSDLDLRVAAGRELARLSNLYQGAVPWQALSRGFQFQGHHFLFASMPRGIFSPRGMTEVLSIKTTIPRGSRIPKYADQRQQGDGDGLLAYDMQDRDPAHPSNRLLRQAYQDELPLVYLQGIAPAVYCPHFPVYVVDWNPGAGRVGIVMGLPCTDRRDLGPPIGSQYQYMQRRMQQRVLQAQFRWTLLEAYGRCALTRLAQPELLSAAHILDRAPDVQNGLCMSHLHHAAFEAHLIGIDADGRIHIARRLDRTGTSPGLQGNFQNLAGQCIDLPSDPRWYPDTDRLEQRFAQFQALDA